MTAIGVTTSLASVALGAVSVIATVTGEEEPPPDGGENGENGPDGNLDANGIRMIYQSAASGLQWDSVSWGNGSVRHLNRNGQNQRERDPEDPYGVFRPAGASELYITGQGECWPLDPNPRLYINNTNFLNVEFTGYMMVVRSIPDATQSTGLVMGVRSGNHSGDCTVCAHTYYSRFGQLGHRVFLKELEHPAVFERNRRGHFSGLFPMNVWIGMKFACYTRSNGDVVLEQYYDGSGGADGGNWQLVETTVDNGNPIWTTACPCLQADRVIRVPGFCFFRNSGLPRASISNPVTKYKWVSVREIQPPD